MFSEDDRAIRKERRQQALLGFLFSSRPLDMEGYLRALDQIDGRAEELLPVAS